VLPRCFIFIYFGLFHSLEVINLSITQFFIKFKQRTPDTTEAAQQGRLNSTKIYQNIDSVIYPVGIILMKKIINLNYQLMKKKYNSSKK